MATVDRRSPNAVLRRARLTLLRAERAALDGMEDSLADDILQIAEEVSRLIESTAVVATPLSAPPGRCA
jgi:hypothetical protein